MTKLNTLGLTSAIGEQINDREFEAMVDIIWFNSKNKNVGKRAGTTVEPNQIHQAFETNGLGKQLKKIEIYGDYRDIFETAYNTEFYPTKDISEDIDLNSLTRVSALIEKNLADIKSKMHNKVLDDIMHIVGETKIQDPAQYDKFRSVFKILETYGSTLIGIYKTIRANGKGRRETMFTFEFNHKNQKAWKLELPAINKNGKFVNNGENYYFMFMPVNLNEYVLGKDDLLEIKHPFSYIIEKLLEVYVDPNTMLPVLLEQQYFDKRIEYTNKFGRINKFQEKLNKILINEKEHYWDERRESPIVWVDRNLSDFAVAMYEKNIAVFAEYDMLEQCGIIKGLDLLTGSTSTPAKRVKVAQGWDIQTINNKMLIVPKHENVTEVESIFTNYKLLYAGTLRTSSKRDNSTTIRSTYNLTKPQKHIKRVTVSSK